jgi:hypothetical protein
MPAMKIIGKDNMNRDHIADRLVLGYVPEDELEKAQQFCDWMNGFSCGVIDDSGTWYELVPLDHRLSRGMEDLI